MLVSHRFKFIYTKTVKTAGTSVEAFFETFCMKEGEWTLSECRDEYVSEAGIIGYRGAHQPEKCNYWNHMSAAQIKRKIGERIWKNYFKFCVVRNPYEKAISAYFFGKAGRVVKEMNFTENEPELFEAWLETFGPPIDSSQYLIHGKFCLDDVIRQEQLALDIERICNRLGLPYYPEALPGFKKGVRPKGTTAEVMYTNKSRKIIERAYAWELKYFGYSFPEPDRME